MVSHERGCSGEHAKVPNNRPTVSGKGGEGSRALAQLIDSQGFAGPKILIMLQQAHRQKQDSGKADKIQAAFQELVDVVFSDKLIQFFDEEIKITCYSHDISGSL